MCRSFGGGDGLEAVVQLDGYIQVHAFHLDTGERIDPAKFQIEWETDDKQSESAIKGLEARKNRFFSSWNWPERVCLTAIVVSAIWSVLLVWWNF
jgi:hypothetical protein